MKYKNWKAICAVPDTHFMWALALLDLTTDFGQGTAERFPEYFTEEKQECWPVPMSVLRMEANVAYIKSGDFPFGDHDDGTTDNIVSRGDEIGGVVNQLPLIKFALSDVIKRYPDLGFSIVPEELESATDVGMVYRWKGKDMVLLENMGDGEWIFTPAECIALDK